ncbi:zinc finger protein 184 isoform X2 [Osmia bicornis bicornis]|uniref:zinc finger protein 184 isoform X2 n=1 Tax=Osmia bicornis bicornis TaxID=1437191 RepID=UPI001EAF067D|nr:zinc finger protein 184 isoform X2 [Osmia bicornis bicornis]
MELIVTALIKYFTNKTLVRNMCARLLTCPLCSQPGFLTLDALRAGLISVATRPLVCPVCNEVLLGIDKLTIHLFSHTINLNNNNVTELPKHTNVVNNSLDSSVMHSQQNTTFQDWNVLETQTADSNKLENHIQSNLKFSKNLPSTRDEDPILNSKVCIQNQNSSLNHAPQVTFLPHQTSENEEINTIHENKQISKSEKESQQILQETLKLNYGTQYYDSNNIKHINFLHNYSEVEHENTETFKNWIQNQNCKEQVSTNENLDKRERPIENEESCNNEQTTTMNNFGTDTSVCINMPLEKYNNYKNMQNNSSTMCNKSENEGHQNEEILPQLKLFKTLSTKEKTERCNICGFHFPDHNILVLHKQLIHTINEKDLNIVPESFLKNYSCHLCSKVFKMKGSLMVHMRVAHMGYNLGSLAKGGKIEFILNENKYSCPTCGKQFKKEQHVMQHLKTHEAKQWECDVCSKMFTTKYFLKKHKRLHSGEMPYKCNICNKTFTFQQSYHKHRLYHKDDKPHTCTTCGRSFKELSTLHNHERIHTGEKPFECETCGKCFRQRVSYLVHRRIHTGVMPYKCTTCGKSFRYKVSQRTHKCSLQQMTNVNQINNPDQQSVCISNTQKISNDSCKNLQENVLEKDQSILNITNDEENKYVLIINTQGQHLLTKESDINKAQNASNKEQKFDEFIGINDKSEETRNTWKSDIPNSPIFKKSVETSKNVENHSKNEKLLQDDTNHFFSMVMPPLENGLSSPTTEMEHLRVSSPIQKQDIFKSYDNFRCTTHEIEMNLINTNLEQNFGNTGNDTNNLQTINEESLKQLLYSINEK